jgi:hypothetical protein
MLELICHHLGKKTKRFIFLDQPTYKVGKALNNDIVLLESEALPFVGTLEKRDSTYIWKQNGTEIDLCKQKHPVFGYEFSIRNYRPWIYGLIFVFVSWISLVGFQQWFGKADVVYNQSFLLPAKGPFGNIGSSNSVEKVKFEFSVKNDAYSILHYTPGSLENEKDLKILINDQLLSYAAPSPERWNLEQTVFIPQKMLQQPVNKLVFQYTGNQVSRWGVKNIFLESTDEMPPQEEGFDWYRVGEKLLKERYARPGNLIRAQQAVRQARQWFELHQQAIPKKLVDLAVKIKQQKKQMIEEHLLLIKKYEGRNETAAVKKIYIHLFEELIDPMDKDRLAVEEQMEK